MPIVYRCKKCGKILATAVVVRKSLFRKWKTSRAEYYIVYTIGRKVYWFPTFDLAPYVIRSIYKGKCPYCGNPIGNPSVEDVKIEISPKWKHPKAT